MYIGSASATTHWYAGQIEDGLITYWKEEQYEPDAEAYPGSIIRRIPNDISNERGGTVSPPSNIIPFPGTQVEPDIQEQPVAAFNICILFNGALCGFDLWEFLASLGISVAFGGGGYAITQIPTRGGSPLIRGGGGLQSLYDKK